MNVSSSIVYYCAYTDNSKEPLVSLTSSALHKVVCEILDVQRFEDYIKEVKTFRKQAETDHKSLLHMIESESARLTECEKDIAFLNSEIATFEKDQADSIARLEKQMVEVAREIGDYDSMLEKRAEIEVAFRQVSEQMKDIEKASSTLKSLKAARSNIENNIAKCTKRFNVARIHY